MFNRPIDSIVSGLSTIVTKLNALAERRAAEVVEIGNKISELDADAEASRKERDKAGRIARKLEEILK